MYKRSLKARRRRAMLQLLTLGHARHKPIYTALLCDEFQIAGCPAPRRVVYDVLTQLRMAGMLERQLPKGKGGRREHAITRAGRDFYEVVMRDVSANRYETVYQ